jgi:hypothetical protein
MKRACLLLLLAASCSKGPSEDQCKQLLDHLVDLEFKKAGAAASSDAMKADLANKKTVTDKVQAEFMDSCTKKMAKGRVECALNANALDGDSGVAKCDEAK